MRFIGISLLFFTTGILSAQIPANPIGINPSSLRWRQIKTDKVQVVYPAGVDSLAQRVANVVHYLWDHDNESIGKRQKPVSIFLQNQLVTSNGFVTVGPFRSEFFLTPPQFNEPTNWLDLLAIHEYRHVKQFANIDQGISKVVHNLFGSWAWGGMFGLALPRWYFEGDATVTETILTSSGRGRLPSFLMEYKALVNDNIHYGYEKAAAGSLKDFVPDWYTLGYFMTGHARERFGPGIWEKVMRDAANYKGIFFPFSRSLKNYTGYNTQQWYKEVRATMDSTWNRPALSLRSQGNNTQLINDPEAKKTISNYNHPLYWQGKIITQRESYKDLVQIVSIDSTGKEQKLTTTGILQHPLNNTLSASAGHLFWTEPTFDLRWRNRQYSVIKSMDLHTKAKKQLTHRTRYFSPAVNAKTDKLVAVEILENMTHNLVILEASTGKLLQTLANPHHWNWAFPTWTADGQNIVVVAAKQEVNALMLINPADSEQKLLTKPNTVQITHPRCFGNYVYFSATFTGINNIFAVALDAPAIYQVTDVTLGAFQPNVSADGQSLVFSQFSSKGYDIAKTPIEPENWKVLEIPGQSPYHLAAALTKNQNTIVPEIPKANFETKKFSKWSGLINPHSWLPYLDWPIIGAQVLSDNKFSTLSASAGAFYNANDDDWTYLANLQYAEFYPVFEGGFSFSNRSNNFFNFSKLSRTELLLKIYSEEWQESKTSGAVSLPFNFSKGPFLHFLRLRAGYDRIKLDVGTGLSDAVSFLDTLNLAETRLNELSYLIQDPIANTRLNAVDLSASWAIQHRMALQNLQPRWGLQTQWRYRSTLGNGPIGSDVLLGRADLFLPGLSRNHSFYLNFSYQQQGLLDNYRFPNLFFFSRGYDSELADDITKWAINYSLPIAYPDWAISPVAFVKRIKANLFYDQTRLQRDFPFTNTFDLRSAGVELTLDARIFRLLEVDFGMRYSYLLDPQAGRSDHQIEFLVLGVRQ